MTNGTPQIKSRKVFDSIHLVDKRDWDAVSEENNIYLSIEYLQAIEDAMKEEIDFYYSLSYDQNGKPCVASAFQIVTYIDKRKHSENRWKCVISKLKSRLFTFNVIVCGNVFSDGENGFLWDNKMTKRSVIDELESASKEIRTRLKKKNKKASIVLFKEFWSKENRYGEAFKNVSFREFEIDVNMVLPIRSDWENMEGYLSSLKKKYRSRARTVFKKSIELELKDLSAEQIRLMENEIQHLFDNVAEKAEFNFGKIKAGAFANTKDALKNNFIFRAAFIKDKIVGFSTAFCNKNVLEANYVGIDYTFNGEKEIYQRILYDFIEQAISLNSEELHLGRTSELIKSAFGAVPENMNLYAKHNNRIRNMLLKPIFYFIAPSDFELRQPFKTEYAG